MVTQNSISRDQIRSLISKQAGDTLSEYDLHQLDTCLMFTAAVRAGYNDGKLICVWGLIPPTLLSEQAYLWLYTTQELRGHEFLFVRHSQLAVEQMLEEYPIITGHCRVAEERSVRWLQWLGAEFAEPVNGIAAFVIQRKNNG